MLKCLKQQLFSLITGQLIVFICSESDGNCIIFDSCFLADQYPRGYSLSDHTSLTLTILNGFNNTKYNTLNL